MPADGLLHAGSVGKTLFAAYALQLVDQRRLQLDEHVSAYIGNQPWYYYLPNAEQITVRMLLNHTSGIPEYGRGFMAALKRDPSKRRTPLDAVRSVEDARPLFRAGTRFSYSDVNYQVLQLLCEQLTDKDAYREIQRRLLDPLRLTRILPATSRNIPGLLPGYAGKDFFLGFDAVMVDSQLVLDPNFEGGGGGFVANAGDLARWIAIFARRRDIARDAVPAGSLDVGANARSGLGIEIAQTPLGLAYGHGGFFPGYLTLALSYPDQGIAVAVQVNSSARDALSRPLREVVAEAVAALKAISPD
jgi:D-alanyl-D-alanine carboxypeptidase